jgi:hypothetical protein
VYYLRAALFVLLVWPKGLIAKNIHKEIILVEDEKG